MSLRDTALAPILVDVRASLERRRRALPLDELRRRVRPDPTRRERFVGALRRDAPAVIAECKRRSPSAGKLSSEVDLGSRAESYARGGASAVSVLTEERHFAGSLDDLAAVASSKLPRLRKDFLLDESMVFESALFGAECVLLIAIVLEPSELGRLAQLARELGLATLIEIHEQSELEAALRAAPDAIGVNSRDLRTLEVDLARGEALLPSIPREFVRIAESGLRSIADLRRMRAAGADAFLIGEALMKDGQPEATLRSWKEALRG